jgi:hypothetical protein
MEVGTQAAWGVLWVHSSCFSRDPIDLKAPIARILRDQNLQKSGYVHPKTTPAAHTKSNGSVVS